MDKGNKSAGYKISRIVLFVLLLVGIALILLYPFDNRNLSIYFITGDAVYVAKSNNLEIAEGKCKEIQFNEPIESVVINKARIYGVSKSLLLKELNAEELWRCIESVEQGEKTWLEEGVAITGVNGIHFYMSDEYEKILQ